MKIGIDLDNVLNDLNNKWLHLYNSIHNDNLKLEDIKGWYIHKYTKIGTKFYDYLNDELFKILDPLPYAIEVTEKLSEKHELYIVTATAPQHLRTKAKWLEKYYPHIPLKNLISTQRKDLVNVDLLIDDAPHNIINFPNKTIVIDYAWNRNLDKEYTRVKNWLEIKKIVELIVDNN